MSTARRRCAEEYLPSADALFLEHEQFFVERVRCWAGEKFGTSPDHERSCVCGFSNGGAFALAVAFRHPRQFAAAIAFSVPAFGPLPLPAADDPHPSIYIAGGNIGPERSIRKNMLRLTRELKRARTPVQFHERDAVTRSISGRLSLSRRFAGSTP